MIRFLMMLEECTKKKQSVVPGGKLPKGHKLYLESRNYDAIILKEI